MSTLKVDTILKRTGTGTITVGQSGDTISIPSGATLSVSGSASGLPDNTPAFSVWLDSTQSIPDQTATKIIFNDEDYDTNSAFDTSNGRFTVPSGEAGKYVFTCSIQAADLPDGKYAWVRWYVNGSNTKTIGGTVRYQGWTSNFASVLANVNFTGICQIDLSVGDYVELFMWHNKGSSSNLDIEMQNFAGYKLIGA